MKIIKITSVSLSLFLISIITSLASFTAQAQEYRMHGSAGCQRHYSADEQYLDNFYFGAYNNHTESIWVVCPMSHDYNSSLPIGYLYVHVVQGAGTSVCYGTRVSEDGSTDEIIGPNEITGDGWYFFYLENEPDSYYYSVNILCNLSPGSYITNTMVWGA